MTTRFPKNIIWNQNNLSDSFSDLWSSFNLNLTRKLGKLAVSGRLLLNISTTDDAQLGAPPCAFKTFITTDTYIWAAANSHMWHSTASGSAGGPNDPFVQDATSGTPTNLSSNVSDIVAFASALVVTEASDEIYLLAAAGTWSNLSNVLTNSSGLHAMTAFRAQNKCYIVDDNAKGITSLDDNLSTVVKSNSGSQYSLDLVEGSGVNVGSEISCIASNSTRIWIGTINKSGGECKIYAWDGSQASGPNEFYIIKASGVLAITILDDVPVIFDTRGRLSQLNGGTFVEMARLPVQGEMLKLPISTATNRAVHYNGMALIDGRINILINTQLWDTNSTNKENMPSGVWEYTRETGLYHKASVGHTKSGGTIVDYGQQKLSLVGALAEAEVLSTDITQGSVNGRYLLGCRYFTTASATLDGIFYDDTNDTLQKAGSFVTSKIFSPNIQDTWQKLTARFRRFLSSNDKIVVKYRTEEDEPTEGAITWASTTTFTSAVTGYAVGDEVEIIRGVGSGRCAHITDITGTTYTLDETITGATTQTATARFQKWKKIASYNAQTDEWWPFPLSVSSVWIQFKVWILWTGKNEIHDLTLSNKASQKIE